ncbi:acyltransferase family protein [Dyella flava]|uniref:Acyltransferase n=1 Tax=Dyella flava TaxID=1920170 RepID=A0ABS2K027_9GAMM|nr:acyltransferase [Dyella flava]MBM7124604.1 acyltransferase [Dyella flava]GLQ49257.1 O-antigen acetylase [Dyella flava]
MKTLSETLARDGNNFDLIRLCAALAVMLGHSYGICGARSFELLVRFTHRESFGSLAVYAFFLISGLLVSASYARQSSPTRFVGLRAARIWPGAIVCAMFTALVVGPLFTSIPLAEYFSNPATYRWLAHNMSLIGSVGGSLPGVFDRNRLGFVVNGAVTTLPIELECYAIILIAGTLGLGANSRRGTIIVVGVVGVIFAYFVKHPPVHITLGGFFVKRILYSFYPVPFFLLGMLLYSFRTRVILHWLPALSLLVGYVALRFTPMGTILLYPAFAYGVLWLASLRQLRWLKPKYDYSYGIYLYGFVIQQTIVAVNPTLSNYLSVAIAIPITVVLAALSWHILERPCLIWMHARHRSADLQAAEVSPA